MFFAIKKSKNIFMDPEVTMGTRDHAHWAPGRSGRY